MSFRWSSPRLDAMRMAIIWTQLQIKHCTYINRSLHSVHRRNNKFFERLMQFIVNLIIWSKLSSHQSRSPRHLHHPHLSGNAWFISFLFASLLIVMDSILPYRHMLKSIFPRVSMQFTVTSMDPTPSSLFPTNIIQATFGSCFPIIFRLVRLLNTSPLTHRHWFPSLMLSFANFWFFTFMILSNSNWFWITTCFYKSAECSSLIRRPTMIHWHLFVYRNGRWRSLWTLQRGTLTGWSKVKVHYYEDGNVQLASTKQYSMVRFIPLSRHMLICRVCPRILRLQQ